MQIQSQNNNNIIRNMNYEEENDDRNKDLTESIIQQEILADKFARLNIHIDNEREVATIANDKDTKLINYKPTLFTNESYKETNTSSETLQIINNKEPMKKDINSKKRHLKGKEDIMIVNKIRKEY